MRYRKAMNRYTIMMCLLLLARGGTGGSVLADDVTFSGAFAGDEPTVAALPGACVDSGALAWQSAGAFTVTAAGDYALADAGELLAVDVQMAIHEGEFSPAAPAAGRLVVIDGGGTVRLQGGPSYELVVQRQCAGDPGAWAVTLSGPGAIGSDAAFPAPPWSVGTLGGNAPQADFGDGDERYRNLGVLQVARSGNWALADVSLYTGLDAEVRLYADAFNPADAARNLVATLDDAGRVFLQAGTDYRVVATAFHPGDTGDVRLTLLSPGDMAINAGLSGAWYEPATAGQGLLLEVYPEQGLVFVAWFTFDVTAPFDPDEATLGDASQRWVTALGAFAAGAASVELAVSNTGRGRFDMRDPGQVQDDDYGSLTLTFHDCASATLDYDLPPAQAVGSIPLSRVVNDNVSLCAEQLPGPGPVVD